jgi:O-antigen ligase
LAISEAAITSADIVERLQRWIRWGLEVLWLLAVVFVPLVYFGRGFGEWSSTLGSFELPKIALLRTAVGLASALWLAEWAIRINFSPAGSLPWTNLSAGPVPLAKRFSLWLAAQPARLITVAVVLFSFSLILSTVFSASLSMSLWGDLPGQDSYGAYTSITYLMLFAVIATHLKTSPQVWRLLGAVMLTGALVAAYAIFQHYGLDFLDLEEPIGVARKSSTLGNPIFAAAILLMTIPITLIAAAVSLEKPVTKSVFWWKLSLWGSLLAVQMLGIIFTFSRGPWGGTVLALSVFLVLTAVFLGWRPLARVATVVTLGVVLTASVIVLPLPAKEKSQVARESQTRIFSAIDEVRAGGQVPVVDPSSSGSALYAGGLSGRIELWQVSWDLMLDHGWFEFDPDGLSWARPIVGYGPDLFRTAFLLKSPPTGPELMPREAGHTHNYFVHQGVELGLVGLVTSLGIFLSMFLVGGHQLLFGKQSLSPSVKFVLVGLLAMAAGRFVEQMVGVARVSDFTIFWALLALFAVVPTAMQAANNGPSPDSPPHQNSGLRKPAMPVVTSGFSVGWKPFLNLAVVCLVVLVGVLTWMKTINYPPGCVDR